MSNDQIEMDGSAAEIDWHSKTPGAWITEAYTEGADCVHPHSASFYISGKYIQ